VKDDNNSVEIEDASFAWDRNTTQPTLKVRPRPGNTKGKYHCTVDLLFDWFGLVYFANKNKNCLKSYS
jgi:hypothetical protein